MVYDIQIIPVGRCPQTVGSRFCLLNQLVGKNDMIPVKPGLLCQVAGLGIGCPGENIHNTCRDGNLFWSDEIYRIFEIDPDSFGASYEAFLEATHPDDREMVNQAYTRSLETRTSYSIEHRLLMDDGRVKYVQELCKTDYAPDGSPIKSIGTVQDITENKSILAMKPSCWWKTKP